MANTLGLVGVVLSGLAFVLGIVGMAIPYWIYASANGKFQSEGLWQLCGSTSSGGSVCISFPVVPSWVAAVRAMSILGFLFIGGAGCCAFLKLFVMKNQASFAKLAGICALASGVFFLIGAIVYGVKINDTVGPNNLFAGFGLVIVAGIIALVSGVVYFIADQRKEL